MNRGLTLKKAYRSYQLKYNQLKKKSPVDMYSKYSRSKFDDVFIAAFNTLKNDNGKKPTNAQVIKKMTYDQQMFKVSRKQAKKAQEMIEYLYGEKASQIDIMTGKYDLSYFYEEIKQFRKDKFSEGFNPEEVNEQVGQTFFGSE